MTRRWAAVTAVAVVGLAALALARPEYYKENEEFKYARSSTDEGSKSGFYEAKRGNQGGNYERAHNMDRVAQGQMSDIVKQVGGQAGEVVDANHGDLFGSAHSSGVYGARNWDTSNLAGRNFRENYRAGASSSAAASQCCGGQGELSDSSLQQTHSGYGAGTYAAGQQSSAAGYQRYSGGSRLASNSESFDQNAINSDMSRQYQVSPVRIAVRPMQPVRLSVSTVAQDEIVDSSHDQVSEQHSQVQSQNSLTQNDDKTHIDGLNIGGIGGHEKHYESSYNYHKEWEKHSDANPIPLSIVTSNPLSEPLNTYNHHRDYTHQNNYGSHIQTNAASNSRLIGGVQDIPVTSHQSNIHERGYQSGHQYQRVAEPIPTRYVVISPTPEFVVSGTKQGSYGASQSQHASNYRSGLRSESHTAYEDQALSQGQLRTNSDNLLASSSRNSDALATITGSNGNIDSTYAATPKKYESSYSYHKSWERQGDPYVIVPASTGSGAQPERLQAQSNHRYGAQKSGYTSHGSHSGSYANQDDCDDNQRHVRSVNYRDSNEDMGQQVQTSWKDHEYEGQQTEDLGQQVEDTWYNSSKHTASQGISRLEDLGQQTEDLGQQSENLGQHLENSGQQVENTWGTLSKPTGTHHMTQPQNLVQQNQGDFGQQVDDLTQQEEVAWEKPSNSMESHNLRHQKELEQRHETSWNQQTQSQAGISYSDMGQHAIIDGYGDTQTQFSRDENMHKNRQAEHNIEMLAHNNQYHKDKNEETSKHTFESGKQLEQGTQQTWEQNNQHVHQTYSNSQHHDGLEQRHFQQQRQTHSYGRTQSSWNSMGHSFPYHRNWVREQDNLPENTNTMQSLGEEKTGDIKLNQENKEKQNNNRNHNFDIVLNRKPELKDISTQYDSNNMAQNNNKENVATVLRGDLGIETITNTSRSTTVKSLTSEEFGQHLDGLLSTIHKTDGYQSYKNNHELIPDHPSISHKVKTPKEIEILSLTDTDVTQSSNLQEQQIIIDNTGFKINQSNYNSENLNQKIEHLDQQMEQYDSIQAETLNFDKRITDLRPEKEIKEEEVGYGSGQETQHRKQETQVWGQQVESLDQNLEVKPLKNQRQREFQVQEKQHFNQHNVNSMQSETVNNLQKKSQELSPVYKQSHNFEPMPLDSDQKTLTESKNNTNQTNPVQETSSQGFWKGVSNKLRVAKDKVSCWFSTCE